MRSLNYKFVDKCIQIESPENGVLKVNFKWPIAEVVQLGEYLIVRTSPEIGSCANQNVHAVDKSGKIVWTVSHRKHVYDDSPYTKILAVNGMLKLFNWDGLELTVDPSCWIEVTSAYGK